MVINFHHGHYLNFISNGGNLPNDIIPTINIYIHASKLTLALVFVLVLQCCQDPNLDASIVRFCISLGMKNQL